MNNFTQICIGLTQAGFDLDGKTIILTFFFLQEW